MNNLFKNIDEAPVDDLNLEWNRLNVSKELLEVLKKEFKFNKMTPVQAASIPLMLENKDVIVEAKTGSGKTLAFLIPIIESLIRRDKSKRIESHEMLALILSPTRELATQIHQELRKILRNSHLIEGEADTEKEDNKRRLGSLLIVGGNSTASDIKKFNKFGANIIVATPGRLSGILEMADNELSSSIRKNLTHLIFDEADQLLSFGFEKNLSSILAYLPKQRRTSLFSATQTNDVEELVKSGLRNPIKVNVNQLESLDKIKKRKLADCDVTKKLDMPNNLLNYYYKCNSYGHKLAILTELLRSHQEKYKKVLVFLSTCSQIDYFSQCIEAELLEDSSSCCYDDNDSHKVVDNNNDKKSSAKNKIKNNNNKQQEAVCILKLHRRLKNKRKAIFKRFKESKRCILFVTDILSRGIDVPDISCVVHLDLPTNPECYVHRSGRSGHQIELSGVSLLLLESFEMDYVEMCRRRQILLEPMNSLKTKFNQKVIDTTVDRLLSWLKEKASKDEPFQTLAIQAFVSYIRFYSSKLCLRELLFPKLPIAQLAKSFGLNRLPMMPELKNRMKKLSTEFESITTKDNQGNNSMAVGNQISESELSEND